MRRRDFITLVGGVAAVWPLATRAQEVGRTYRLGCLLPLPRDAPINIAFFGELRRRGFIEGQNLTVEYRAYGLHPDLISEYAAELVKARVDVITTAGTDEAIRAAQQATKAIPILAMSDDMVGSGLVGSMARPNGNTTGVSMRSGSAHERAKWHILQNQGVEVAPRTIRYCSPRYTSCSRAPHRRCSCR